MQSSIQQPMAAHEVLYRHARECKYCDVLIDRMAGFPFQDEIEALDNSAVHLAALNDPIFAESPKQAPLLVRLPWTETALLEKYLACALQEATDLDVQTRSVCAFLFSKLDQSVLAKRLAKRLDVLVQTVGSIYFRYFDPRVMQQLPGILSTEQLAGMLHGVQQWGYVSWSGQFNVIQEPLAESRPAHPAMSMTQWDALQRIELINATLRTLQLAEVALVDDADQRIDAHIKTAKIAGISSTEDQVTYAAYSMKFGEGFTRHPDLTKNIAMTTASKVPLADVLEQKFGGPLQSAVLEQTPGQRAST